MNRVLAVAITSASMSLAVPASATVVGFTPNVSFASSPYTVTLFYGSTYTFSPIPLDGNDTKFRTAALATTGSATACGGGFIGDGEDYTSYRAGSPNP